MQLYVGEGAVGWGPRLRFWAQTEITLLTLVPTSEDAGAPSSSMETDSSHPSQTGGLLASVLLIGSVAYVLVRQMLVARGLLEKALCVIACSACAQCCSPQAGARSRALYPRRP